MVLARRLRARDKADGLRSNFCRAALSSSCYAMKMSSAEGDLNPTFFREPYDMKPQNGGDEANELLREALKKCRKIGLVAVLQKSLSRAGERRAAAKSARCKRAA